MSGLPGDGEAVSASTPQGGPMPLTVIKKEPKILDYKVYDLEWYPKEMRLRLIGTYDGETHEDYGTNLAAFLDGELTPENNGKVWFAHAGGLADMQFVFDEIIMRRPDWRVSASFSGSSAIIVRVEDEAEHSWVFGDSLWLLRDSLDNIGKSVGLHKGGGDYYCSDFPRCGHAMKRGSCLCADGPLGAPCPRGRKCMRKPTCIFYAPLPVLRAYNQRDNEVLWTALDRLQQELLAVGSELKMTIASTAMTTFRRGFLSGDVKTSKRVNEIARRAYVASRVEVFTPSAPHPIDCWDINSSFPKSMTEPQPGAYKGTSKTWNGSRLSLVEASITVPSCYLPPLPVRYQKKKSAPPRVFFPVGSWRRWYTGTDLELLLEAGGRIERVHRVLDFEPNTDLRAYVELFYGRRKAEKDEFRRLVYKYLLNSLACPLLAPLVARGDTRGPQRSMESFPSRLSKSPCWSAPTSRLPRAPRRSSPASTSCRWSPASRTSTCPSASRSRRSRGRCSTEGCSRVAISTTATRTRSSRPRRSPRRTNSERSSTNTRPRKATSPRRSSTA